MIFSFYFTKNTSLTVLGRIVFHFSYRFCRQCSFKIITLIIKFCTILCAYIDTYFCIASPDSAAQTGHATRGDWQELVYQKVRCPDLFSIQGYSLGYMIRKKGAILGWLFFFFFFLVTGVLLCVGIIYPFQKRKRRYCIQDS